MKAEGKATTPLSFVEQVGEYATPHCGYCGSDVESASMVHVSHTQTPSMSANPVMQGVDQQPARHMPHAHGSVTDRICHGQGMWAHNLTPEAYQELLDRGWRRSGRWLYRPLQEKLGCSCAPYTIRCNVHTFRASKVTRPRVTSLSMPCMQAHRACMRACTPYASTAT